MINYQIEYLKVTAMLLIMIKLQILEFIRFVVIMILNLNMFFDSYGLYPANEIINYLQTSGKDIVYNL